MTSYRFEVPMSMSFSIEADNEEDAQALANEFVDTFVDGASIGPDGGWEDARVYSTDSKPVVVCIEV